MHILHLYIRLMDKTDNQYQVIGPLILKKSEARVLKKIV